MTNPVRAIEIGIKALRRTPTGRKVIREFKQAGDDAANWTRSTLRSATNRANRIEAGQTVRPLKPKAAYPPTTSTAGAAARARAAAAAKPKPAAAAKPKPAAAAKPKPAAAAAAKPKTTTTKGTTPSGGKTTTTTTKGTTPSRMTSAQKAAVGTTGAVGGLGLTAALTGNKRKQAVGTGTQKAQPRSKPKFFSGLMAGSPPLPNTRRGSDTPLRATKLNQTVDEYAEAFKSPDASKMSNLSEKNRRKDMNMLERAFNDIKLAGERASAERRKQGKSDFDMNEDVYGMKRGGRLSSSKKNKTKGRKRAARRGFGVETRGS